ncbi:MAG: hypothetical protein WB681_07490 [Candidatus Cybelea sp.]
MRSDAGTSARSAGDFERHYYQRFLIPLVNASISREFVAHTRPNYKISIVSLSEYDKKRWRDHPQVKCAIGGFAWMLERAASGVLLEGDYGGNDPLSDEAAANALGSLMAFVDVRLPYVLWTPFGEHRLQGWPPDDYKIIPIGNQRIPGELEAYATMNVDDETFQRYWSEIFDQSESGLRLRRALGRHRHARVSYYREDAILNAFIGLEALFADHTKDVGKIPNKVTRRVARFIRDPDVSQSMADLIGVSDRLAELYQIRHKIVHGAEPDAPETENAARDSIRLLATVICITLEEGFGRLKDRPRLAREFDKALLATRREEKRAARNRKKGDRDPQ